MRLFVFVFAGVLGAGGCSDDRPCASWSQWGQGGSHGGNVCVSAQTPAKVLATVDVDPFGFQETSADQGDLLVHYQVPLVVGDDVYVLQKGGTFTAPCAPPDGGEVACYSWSSQTWQEAHYRWSGGKLEQDWMFASDWKPMPSELAGDEPLFQPVVVGDAIYVPAAGGTLRKLDRHSGAELTRLDPFGGAPDPDRYVSGPLVADGAGRVWYNVVKVDHAQPVLADAQGWIVVATANDQSVALSYDDLLAGIAPTGTSCHGTYGVMQPAPPLPWPPLDGNGQPMPAPIVDCGSQRPGLNVAPAVGPDGTVFTVSRAHFSSRDSFVVALNPDTSVKWVTSLGRILADGCGVAVPSDGDPTNNPYACTPGAPVGVDPATGQPPAGRVVDESSSSPVALPDGGVLYGAFTGYNGVRGHLFKLDSKGRPVATYDYGWDYTPAVWQHGGTYSIVVKDNHYRYDQNGTPLGPYYITQLDPNLNIEWQFRNTNTQSCRWGGSDGQSELTCVADHPNGFEWCINAPAIDKDGTVYAGGEDGVVYAIGQGGVDKGHLFLSMSLGAAYTPLAIDRQGRLYTQNDGKMLVVGK